MTDPKKQSDLKPFKHGEEMSHYACSEMMLKFGGGVGCCGCNHHVCRKQDELPSKSEEDVTTTEQNTKQTVSDINVAEWEKEIEYLFHNGGSNLPYSGLHTQYSDSKYANKATKGIVKDIIRDLLASQRHQLKEQVLEAVGEDEEVGDMEPKILSLTAFEASVEAIKFQARNELRREQRERIEAIFEEKET